MNKLHVVKIKDVKPNPFRNLDSYPLNRQKIRELRKSIRKTGFWANVVARINARGDVEIAYGHHRIKAAQRELGRSAEIELVIRA